MDFFLPMLTCKNDNCKFEKKPEMSEMFSYLSDSKYVIICSKCKEIMWIKDEEKRKEYEKKGENFIKNNGKIGSFEEFKGKFSDIMSNIFT